MRGFLINAINHKGKVFLLAVAPQFVNPALALTPQYVVLASTLAFTDLVTMGLYTLRAAKVLRLLRDARHIRWMNRVFGSFYSSLLAFFSPHSVITLEAGNAPSTPGLLAGS